MDIATLIGMVLGALLVIISIVMGSPLSSFINAPGLVIVVGGTIAATFVTESMGNVIGSFKIAMHTFFVRSPDIEATIKTIAELAVIVRKEGLLALENQQIDSPFLAKGVRLAVDGIPPEEIQAALRSELVALKARHKRGRKLFKFMGNTAPAMGMIGTLIGLVQMLRALDNPATIGPAMAVALLTTFYGAVMAFMIFGPMAEKLEIRDNEETANMRVIVDGLDSILRGENARIVQEKLEGFLAPAQRSNEEK